MNGSLEQYQTKPMDFDEVQYILDDRPADRVVDDIEDVDIAGSDILLMQVKPSIMETKPQLFG
jgi:hypothetical protein